METQRLAGTLEYPQMTLSKTVLEDRGTQAVYVLDVADSADARGEVAAPPKKWFGLF